MWCWGNEGTLEHPISASCITQQGTADLSWETVLHVQRAVRNKTHGRRYEIHTFIYIYVWITFQKRFCLFERCPLSLRPQSGRYFCLKSSSSPVNWRPPMSSCVMTALPTACSPEPPETCLSAILFNIYTHAHKCIHIYVYMYLYRW